ncbi:EZH inhibitory protein [Artibeus jamaicensis]|uniref:EZH inhibitory protein n=1 Tax=Artibeus jamaicensis TaxID=9417 RepID=UPI00235B1096|nr:EZH inhibitory protein [Artibeus jamaicensis]
MATQSHLEKEQKQQQAEGPPGPKNKVVTAPGDARGTGHGGAALGAHGLEHLVPPPVSWPKLSRWGGPGPPSMPCVRESGCPELRGGPSPHTEVSCVAPETAQGLQTAHSGKEAAAGQAVRGGGVQASGRATHTTGPANGRGRKRHSRRRVAQAHKLLWRCLFPEAPASQSSVPLPPSSPRAEPRSRRSPGASPSSPASPRVPDLQSRTTPPPGPVLRSRATLRGPAACCFCAPRQGRAVRRCASVPGPASRPRSASAAAGASARGPAPSCSPARAPPRCAAPNHASRSGTALHSLGSAPGPARRRRGSAPGPARRRRGSAPGPARRRRVRTRSCSPALRIHSRVPGHSRCAPGPSGGLGCSASAPSPASRSRPSEPGPALRSPASGLSPALRIRSSPISPIIPISLAVPSSSTTAGFVPQRRPTQSSAPRPSANEFPDQGPSSPPTNVSGHSSSSSSPNFHDLALSPASLRRALLLEFDPLSPASPGEQAEICFSMHDSPTPPPRARLQLSRPGSRGHPCPAWLSQETEGQPQDEAKRQAGPSTETSHGSEVVPPPLLFLSRQQSDALLREEDLLPLAEHLYQQALPSEALHPGHPGRTESIL